MWRHLHDNFHNIVCECDICLHSQHNSNKTFNITKMRSQAWHINQHAKDDRWSNKWKGSKTKKHIQCYFMFVHMHVTEDMMIWNWQAILQTQISGVLEKVLFTYHQDDHAFDGVCMWFWSFPLHGSLVLLLNSLEVNSIWSPINIGSYVTMLEVASSPISLTIVTGSCVTVSCSGYIHPPKFYLTCKFQSLPWILRLIILGHLLVS